MAFVSIGGEWNRGIGPSGRGLYGVITESSRKGWEIRRRGEAGWESSQHRHICEVETARGASSDVVVIHGKVPVAVCVGAGWCNMGRVEHIGIDKVELEMLDLAEKDWYD